MKLVFAAELPESYIEKQAYTRKIVNCIRTGSRVTNVSVLLVRAPTSLNLKAPTSLNFHITVSRRPGWLLLLSFILCCLPLCLKFGSVTDTASQCVADADVAHAPDKSLYECIHIHIYR